MLRAALVARTFPLEMILKLVPPLLHDADRGQRRGVAERAERAPEHVLRKLVDQRDVFLAAAALVEAVEHLAQPRGAFAAGNAPAAGFVRVEMHDAARDVHHAGVFVHDHRAARAEHRADLGHRIVIHGDVDFVGRKQRAGTAAGNHGFQFLAARHAARDFFDQPAQREAQGQFVNAGAIDVAGNRIEARAAIFRRAQSGIPFAAAANDRRNGAERFHVVDDGGAAVEADDGGEGRLDARIAALAFERFHQRRFFAALVGARAGVRAQDRNRSRCREFLAQIALGVGFGDAPRPRCRSCSGIRRGYRCIPDASRRRGRR